jgi:WD40 repeat protein
VRGATISPCGRWVAVVDSKGQVGVWAVATGKYVDREILNVVQDGIPQWSVKVEGAVWCLPTGNAFKTAVSSKDESRELQLSHSMLKLVTRSTGVVTPVAIDIPPLFAASLVANDLILVTGGAQTTVSITTVSLPPTSPKVIDLPSRVNSVAFHPSGTQLACSLARGLRIITVPEGKDVTPIATMKWNQYCRAAYSSCGRYLACHNENVVSVLEADTGKEVATIKPELHRGPVGDRIDAIAFQPSGSLVAIAMDAGQIHLWDLTTQKEVRSLYIKDTYRSLALAFSPDGKRLATGARFTAKNEAIITIWDVESGASLLNFTNMPNAQVVTLAWSTNCKWLASGSYPREPKEEALGELKVFDTQTGEIVHTLQKSKDGYFSVDFSQDGRRLISATGSYQGNGVPTYGEVIVWDMATGLDLFRIRQPHTNVLGLALSPDGRWFAYGASHGQEAKVIIHDLPNEKSREAPPHAGRP